MMNEATTQLHAIHAMLSAGQRNLRIERHTLMLLGVPAGVLFVLSEHVLTPEQIPDLPARALAWLGLLAVVLTAVLGLDWFWTRRAKAIRDEAWSFVHRQVIKVGWLLMGLAVLTTFAMFFYGGGYMVCAVWLVFLGITLYLHGLFSEELLEWAGLLIILIGVIALVVRLDYETMRWVAAAVFGIGLPLLALMLDRGRHRPARQRLLQMLGWLVVVLAFPLWLVRIAVAPEPMAVPTLSLSGYRALPVPPAGEIAVLLPAGTLVPVDVELGGDVFTGTGARNPVLSLALSRPLEVRLRDGKLTGAARFPGESWQQARQVRWLSIPWLKAELTPVAGPQVTGRLEVRLRE